MKFEDARFTVQGDIYALGIVAFELITGLSPFNGKTLIESMQMRLKGDIPSPRSIAPSCPEGVAEVIINATLKDPTKRYQKVLEFVENLERVMSKQAS